MGNREDHAQQGHHQLAGLISPGPPRRVTTELGVIVHPGSLADVDWAYGALAAYVASHALGVDGPIREYYLVGRQDTPTKARGGPRSAGPSSAPGRPPQQTAMRRTPSPRPETQEMAGAARP
jgi:hypothetical protein